MSLRLGLLVNPLAGIGGPLGLKGSDGEAIVEQALSLGAKCLANQRVQVALLQLQGYKDDIEWFSAPGIMGEASLIERGFVPTVVGTLEQDKTTAKDTQFFAKVLIEKKLDLLLFAGGDGTARNIFDVIAYEKMGHRQLVLGIPAGVKMHSGVYAISPQAAARIVLEFLELKPVSISLQEVRDIDEDKLRAGQINSRYYGDLLVPNDDRYVQQVKNSVELDESAMQLEIATGIVDEMDNETLYIIGAGTTPRALMDELGLQNTLLGVDVILGRELIANDIGSPELSLLLDQHPYHPTKIVMTATGGQGHIIGRGNQQLSASLLKKVAKDNISLVITPNKLAALNGRPLLMDSGDIELDREWSGRISIITGYQQYSTYPLSSGE
ncbi:MAG: putative polyphosphate/ATP-dependent NAD kinase [Cellvibrionaceae bacterium]|jgi:predicted polyphosphate/ATP-dependent NAD kinase